MRRFLVPKAIDVTLTALLAGILWSSPAPAHATGVTAIGAGNTFMCSVGASTDVMCWGDTNWQATTPAMTPVSLNDESGEPLDRAWAVDGGWIHGCVLTTGGGIKCWGFPFGPIGGPNVSPVAVPLAGLEQDVVSMSAGNLHGCAVLTDGSVMCWGKSDGGLLGFDCGLTPCRDPVVLGSNLSGVVDIAAGATQTCALMQSSTVKCWGHNFAGQLGDGTTTDSATPVDVIDGEGGVLTGVTGLAAGFWHTCAGLAAGGVKCWGDNYSGQLGSGAIGGRSLVPVDVLGVGGSVVDLSLNVVNSCAVVSSGVVKCWGDNSRGQLGASAPEICPDPNKGPSVPVSCSSVALSVEGLASGATGVAVAGEHTCALLTTQAVQCWGNNSYGQLGNGTTIDSLTPVDVLFDSDRDGCADVREQGADPRLGGARDPKSFWDFFDTPDGANVRDRFISIGDIGRVVGRFGTAGDPAIDPLSPPPPSGYHTAFDRSPPAPGADLWDAGPADGSVGTGDLGAVVAQFGHGCA